jgi:hypothetical protein
MVYLVPIILIAGVLASVAMTTAKNRRAENNDEARAKN